MMNMEKGKKAPTNRSQFTSVSKVVKDPNVPIPDENSGLGRIIDRVEDVLSRRVTSRKVSTKGSRKNLVIVALGITILIIVVGRS